MNLYDNKQAAILLFSCTLINYNLYNLYELCEKNP